MIRRSYQIILLLVLLLLCGFAYKRARHHSTTKDDFIPKWSRRTTLEYTLADTLPLIKHIEQASNVGTVIVQLSGITKFLIVNDDELLKAKMYPCLLQTQSPAQVLEIRRTNAARMRGRASSNAPQQRIPRLTHHVWISGPTIPQGISTQVIAKWFKDMEKLTEYTHCIWFYNLNEHQRSIERFENKNEGKLKLVFFDLVQLSILQYGGDLFDYYYDRKAFTHCEKIVRYNLLYLLGGISFAWTHTQNLTELSLDSFLWADYVNTAHKNLFTSEMLVSKPRGNVYYVLLTLLDQLYRNQSSEWIQTDWCAPEHFTWAMDTHCGADEGYLAVPTKRSGALDSPTPGFFTRKNEFSAQFYSLMLDEDPVYLPLFARNLDTTIAQLQRNRAEMEVAFHKHVYNSRFYTSEACYVPFKIPLVLHRIWLTRDREIPQQNLNYFYETCQILQRSREPWKIIFWTNRREAIPQTVQFLQTHCPTVEIREIDPGREIKFARRIYDALLADQQYARASDLARYNIVYEHGGVYLDIGISLLNDPTPLIRGADQLAWLQLNAFVDIGLIGCSTRDVWLREFLVFLEERQYKAFGRQYFRTGLQQCALTGHPYLTALLCAKYSNRKIVFFQDNFYFRMNRMNSWYQHTKASTLDLWDL